MLFGTFGMNKAMVVALRIALFCVADALVWTRDAKVGPLTILLEDTAQTASSVEAVAQVSEQKARAFLVGVLAKVYGGDSSEKEVTALSNQSVVADVEKRMMDAASKEAGGSQAANDAARKMTQATSSRVDSILETATKEIFAVVDKVNEELIVEKASATRIARTELEAEAASQEAMKRSTESASTRLKTATSEEIMISAVVMSDTAIENALKEALKIRGNLSTTSSKLKESVDKANLLTRRAVETVRKVATLAKSDADALGNQLKDVGAKTSAELKAKSSADIILIATSDVAARIREKVEAFSGELKLKTNGLQLSGDQTAKEIADLAANTKAQGDVLASRLENSATQAKDDLMKAKMAWVAAGVEAVQVVERMAQAKEGATTTQSTETPFASASETPTHTSKLSLASVTLCACFVVVMFGIFAMYKTKDFRIGDLQQ